MIYFDMDGVLAVWNTEATPEDTQMPGYFLDREVEESVRDLIKLMLSLDMDVGILSAVWNENAAKEKSEWLEMIFGRNDTSKMHPIFVPFGENKVDYIVGPHRIINAKYSAACFGEGGVLTNPYYKVPEEQKDCRKARLLWDKYRTEKMSALEKSEQFRVYTAKSTILIDDYTDNLISWERSDNKAIKFLNGINNKSGRWKGACIGNNMSPLEMLAEIARVSWFGQGLGGLNL